MWSKQYVSLTAACRVAPHAAHDPQGHDCFSALRQKNLRLQGLEMLLFSSNPEAAGHVLATLPRTWGKGGAPCNTAEHGTLSS